MFGRLLAGIATSILYSAFESWLIYEHKNVSLLLFIRLKKSQNILKFLLQRGFEESSLGEIFANAYFGNSVVAILAGVIAQYAANIFGYV